MDRGYDSYNLMAHFQEKGWFYIIRKKDKKYASFPSFDKSFNLKLCRKQNNTLKKLYRDDPDNYLFIAHTQSFDFLPSSLKKYDPISFYTLNFRLVHIELQDGKYETLITNTSFSPEQLKSLYAQRWGIETGFRALKHSIGLVNFHSKKKEGILQEIYSRFINYNFCQWLTTKILPKNSNRKLSYKICFSDASYSCRLFFNGLLSSFKLKDYLVRHLSAVRPNRRFDRRLRTQAAVSFTYRIS